MTPRSESKEGIKAALLAVVLASALASGCSSTSNTARLATAATPLPAATALAGAAGNATGVANGSATGMRSVATDPAIFDWPATGNLTAQSLRYVDDYIDADIAGNVIPGAVLMVMRDGKLVYEKA